MEMEEGHAHASPAALDGGEDLGLFGEEGLLLLGCEFEDAAAFVLCGEGGEDAVVEAEVRVAHVRGFDGSGKLEGEAAEEFNALVDGVHGADNFTAMDWRVSGIVCLGTMCLGAAGGCYTRPAFTLPQGFIRLKKNNAFYGS
jgi:hypothetical protein